LALFSYPNLAIFLSPKAIEKSNGVLIVFVCKPFVTEYTSTSDIELPPFIAP
jgi:hypothetical protein